MKKYLYLGKKEWAETWVNGGQIPISPASSYYSDERVGIMTPDENLIHKGEVPIPSLRQYGLNFSSVRNLNMSNNVMITSRSDGSEEITKIPDVTNGSYYKEDGLILSFCNHLSPDTAFKFDKVVCVEIIDIIKMKGEIDRQLGVIGQMKNCEYTDDHQRDHFLKFKADSWQDEFRIFWALQKCQTWVNIPSGTAKIVWTF